MHDRTDVHCCPFCELRFLYSAEVRDHIISDHPEHAEMALSAEPHELPKA